jgi:hypothetical protein
MAASITIEEEFGTCTGFLHPHNGYYAGDFSQSSRARSERPVSHAAIAHQARNRRQPAVPPVREL